MSGLRGTYDFKLEWITAGEARQGNVGPSMIDAIQDHLGLKMERGREAVEMVVSTSLTGGLTEN